MLPPIMPVSRLTGAVPVPCRSPLFALFLMILLFPLLLGACAGGGGGGGLSSAGPVVLVDGTDRFADEDDEDGGSPPTPGADPSEEWVGGTPTPGTVPDPAFYETAEYDAGQRQPPLAVTRFRDAYARGCNRDARWSLLPARTRYSFRNSEVISGMSPRQR